MLELEKTYLVKYLPEELSAAKPVRIMDIYIPEDVPHAHLRLRQKGDKYEMTKKTLVSEGDASTQTEETIRLDESEFLALAQCSARKVVKNRYKVKFGRNYAEIDVFLENLAGLVLVDFEFETEKEKSEFVPPEFVLCDVTQEEFVAGGFLAGKKYDEIADKLKQFGYQKLGKE